MQWPIQTCLVICFVMIHRWFPVSFICLCLSFPLRAQISRDAKFEMLRTVLAISRGAHQHALWSRGRRVVGNGEVNKDKLDKEMKNGQSIVSGKS
jgi:hypothetical protein